MRTDISTDIPFEKLKDEDEIIRRIEDNVEKWFEYFAENIENAKKDILFALGTQWESHEIAEYYLRSKIFLTVNVIYAQLSQIVAEQAQNSPQIQVRALTPQTDQKSINLAEGLLRNIAYDSQSDIAYQTAFSCALLGGYGAWRVVVDYQDPKSFNQVAKIERIEDPLRCYFDKGAIHPTKCDGEYCGVYTRLSWEEFKSQYPDIDNPESLFPPMEKNVEFSWYDSDGVTICEHFQKLWKKTKIYQLNNGDIVTKEELADKLKELHKQKREANKQFDQVTNQLVDENIDLEALRKQLIPGVEIVDERDTETYKIMHYKIIKGHILDKTEFPGKYLPVLFLDGDSHIQDDKQVTRSFVKFSRDAQKFLNYSISEIAQWLKIGHKGQFLATEGMIGDYKELWRNPETPSAALLYRPDPVTRQAPTYIQPAELPQSLLSMPGNLLQLVNTITGRYEANLGAQGNERSGVAIANRAKQGNLANYKFIDNLNVAIEQTNKILLELLPSIYDNERHIMIRNKDGSSHLETINQNEKTFPEGALDVAVTIGASFEMQKAEAFSQLMSLVQLNPQALSTILADLLAQNTNLDNTPQIVERVRKYVVPPQVIADEEGKQLPPSPPDPQLVIMQQEAQARLLEAQAKIAKVQQEGQIAQVKGQAELGKAAIDYQGKIADHTAKMQLNALKSEHEQLKLHAARVKNLYPQV